MPALNHGRLKGPLAAFSSLRQSSPTEALPVFPLLKRDGAILADIDSVPLKGSHPPKLHSGLKNGRCAFSPNDPDLSFGRPIFPIQTNYKDTILQTDRFLNEEKARETAAAGCPLALLRPRFLAGARPLSNVASKPQARGDAICSLKERHFICRYKAAGEKALHMALPLAGQGLYLNLRRKRMPGSQHEHSTLGKKLEQNWRSNSFLN